MSNEPQNNGNLNPANPLQRGGMSRRGFLQGVGSAGAVFGLGGWATAADAPKDAAGNVIPGFEVNPDGAGTSGKWEPFSDRKIRVGIAGFGLCQFGTGFGFQDHPNVEIVAVTDLDPVRRAGLAKACRSGKSYPSCEDKVDVKTGRPALPPGMGAGGHGGSHGQLTSEFVDAILRDRNPWIDIAQSLNMTVAGIVAHQSALKDGELLKIPQYLL